MAPRFDDDNLILRLSVADVIDRHSARTFGFANRGGFERMWLGQAIHSQYQERRLRRDRSYRSEVHVEVDLEHRGWTVRIRGRIDGLRREADGTAVIEEIKSVRPETPLGPAVSELYHRQAQLYAWMLEQSQRTAAEENGAEAPPTPRAELVLIELGSDVDVGLQREPVRVELELIEAQIRQRANTLLREHERKRSDRARRAAAAETLEFPFHQPRPGQELILEAVEQALDQREHLLVEASTGLGKTVAALFPVLRDALRRDRKVYVLTAKNTQQAMSTRVLDLLNKEEAFRSLLLRAKSRMCANGEVICHEDYCDYAKEYFAKLQSTQVVGNLLERHPHLEPDAVYDAAKESKVCPFEVSLELSRQTQVVVCDYNYVFDPYVALSDFADDQDLRDVVLVVDEVHNLVDRGRGYYSPKLTAAEARRCADQIGQIASGDMAWKLARLATELADVIDEEVEEVLGPVDDQTHRRDNQRDIATEAQLPDELLWELRPRFDGAFIQYLEHRRETKSFRAEDPFVELYFRFIRFLNTLQLARRPSGREAFSECVERTTRGKDRGNALALLCKDCSSFLGRTINRCHSVVGLSATLQPTEFYRDLLGFDAERTADVQVPNPFPEEHRAVVVDAAVETAYRVRHKHVQPIAERLAEMCNAVPGNCLALFPSYAFLQQVADLLPDSLAKRVLVQQRSDGEEQRREILDSLSSALFGDVLLLAVAGGVFAEGVDYPGDMLKAVAVIGPCLPQVSLEQKLLQEYYEERFERGFEYAFVVPGMTRVVQAAGRLIRSPTDRGVIALFDKRFTAPLYRRHLPLDWLDDDQVPQGHPATVASAFFAEPEPAEPAEPS